MQLALRKYVLAIFATLVCLEAESTTWHVGPDGTGNDGNSGLSTNSPFATLGAALFAAINGDTIHAMAGTHTQSGTLYVTKSVGLVGDGRYDTTIFFPTNFTALQNIHAVSIYASDVSIQHLTVQRENFLPFGAVIECTGIEYGYPVYFHNILLDDLEIVGGTRGLVMNPGTNFVMRDCAVHGLDAASNDAYLNHALSTEITGLTGSVSLVNNYFDGTLRGLIGGTRVRRAFQLEQRTGQEICAGRLLLASNYIYNVREPFLWDIFENPLTNKASVEFVHNTVHVTEKTSFTIFAVGTGPGGSEHLKFDALVVRDNLFANIGGTSVGRCDYQAGNFARNFPIGGFTFGYNMLFLDAPHSAVDSLATPLATDPGWFSGSEFNTNSQSFDLRVDYTNQPPFLDPLHSNRNFALNGATASGRAALGGASDGGNCGAWATPRPIVNIQKNGSDLIIAWASISNLTYRAEMTESFIAQDWQSVGATQQAAGSSLAVTDDVSAAESRWYRAAVVE